MAKKTGAKPKATRISEPKPKKTAKKSTTVKLTYTAEMEVVVPIKIMPGHTPAEVLEAIHSGKADFFHEIGKIEVKGKVLATLSKPHLLNDEYDDFEIEPL